MKNSEIYITLWLLMCLQSIDSVSICKNGSATGQIVSLSNNGTVYGQNPGCICLVQLTGEPDNITVFTCPDSPPQGCYYKLDFKNENITQTYSCKEHEDAFTTGLLYPGDVINIQVLPNKTSTNTFNFCLKMKTEISSSLSLTCYDIGSVVPTIPPRSAPTTTTPGEVSSSETSVKPETSDKQETSLSNIPTSTNSFTPTEPQPTDDSRNLAAIVGGAVGGVVVIILIVVLIICLVRKKRKQKEAESSGKEPHDYMNIGGGGGGREGQDNVANEVIVVHLNDHQNTPDMTYDLTDMTYADVTDVNSSSQKEDQPSTHGGGYEDVDGKFKTEPKTPTAPQQVDELTN